MSTVPPVVSSKAMSGSWCRPQPALFLAPTLSPEQQPRIRGTSTGGETLPQEEALHLPQVKTPNFKHIFSIKYLTSLKVINIYHVL